MLSQRRELFSAHSRELFSVDKSTKRVQLVVFKVKSARELFSVDNLGYLQGFPLPARTAREFFSALGRALVSAERIAAAAARSDACRAILGRRATA